ncbi:MAG TPA: hypothetical protein VKU00_21050 [Chthonomonadaceae bacterium]|nr:hypothetical protein [Chthonomonadaceae bacterium]
MAAHASHRLTEQEVAQHSLALCARFSDSAHLVQTPQFHLDWNCGRERAIWTTICEADGKRYWIKINDTTGVLVGLAPEQSVLVHLATESSAAPLETPAAAADTGLAHLKEMELFPVGTPLALKAAPTSVDHGRGWKVVWQVHPKDAAAYEIRIVLARRGGAPVMVLNGSELAAR